MFETESPKPRRNDDDSIIPFKCEALENEFRGIEREIDEAIELDLSGNPLAIPGIPHLTAMGNAERLVARYGDRLRYVWSGMSGYWLVWDGRVWNRDAGDMLDQFSKGLVSNLVRDSLKVKEQRAKMEIFKHALRTEQPRGLEDMLYFARSDEKVAIRPPALDSDPWLLCCLNGTIDLRTGELRKHNPDDLITRMVPVSYDPDAKSELFDRFLADASNGDKELERYLQRALGFSTCGDYAEEQVYFVYGPTASGKSTLMNAVRSTLGPFAATASGGSFLQTTPSGPRNDLAQLDKTRFVLIDELNHGQRVNVALLKQWCGSDAIRVRFLYHESFEIVERGRLWFSTNFAPKLPDDDDAVWRRVRVVPFNHAIPEEKRDPDVKRDLCNPKLSGAAILAWLVKGCLAYQKEGLTPPAAVASATAAYRHEVSDLNDWLEERCEIQPGNLLFEEESSSLWEDYHRWASNEGVRYPIKSQREFGKKLGTYGFDHTRVRKGSQTVRVWRGIQLRPADSVGSE